MRRTGTRKRKVHNKKYKKAILTVGCLIFIIIFFSVIFSILNMGNSKIAKGVKIGIIDVSNLTGDEAKEKLEKWYKEIILKNVTAVYQGLEETIITEKIIDEINIDKKVEEAMLIGKTGNVIKDNYEILSTLIFSKEIENKIEINQEEVNKIIEEINMKLPNAKQESSYYIESDKLIIAKGKIGVEIDTKEFKNELKKTIYESEKKQFTIPVKEEKPKEINIEKIHQEIYKEAQNAEIEENPIQIKPEVNGMDFAISLEEAKKILQEEKEEYIIDLKITIPEVTLKELGTKAFPETLAEYSTTYNSANVNREINLKLASEKIDGTIILPGEIFSYNKIVGQRTIANGYKEAAVYANGKVVDGIGGGICQLSSTLYNTAICANLEITERSNHRFLTSYVTAGRDATVSWGTIDFCFKNTRKYPIKIESSVKNGVVTTKIHGIKEEKEYEISIESKITETIPYSVSYVKDEKLEQGTEQIIQYGANGAKSETYKIEKENGVIKSRTLISSDTYSPLERIVKKGTEGTQGVNAEPINEEVDEINRINPKLLETIKELD